MRSALYTGTVMHARRTPRANVFRYPVCFFVLDLDELPELERRLALFGYNRRNLVTLRDRDHLGDPELSIKENVIAYLRGYGIDLVGGRILLLTNLRVAGYVFNPVSFYYCYAPEDRFVCAIAEVNNTFGEQFPYLLSPENELAAGTRSYRLDKRLHVSPFFPLDQAYNFFLSEPNESVRVRIDVLESDGRPFWATITGRRRELTNASLAGALVRYPLMPLQVIGLIHWQALKLYLKGSPFHRKPPFVPGRGSVTRAGADAGEAPASRRR